MPENGYHFLHPESIPGFKQQKAQKLVAAGYSVAWLPDNQRYMEFYLPSQSYRRTPEYRSTVIFSRQAESDGLDGGAIQVLSIRVVLWSIEDFIEGSREEYKIPFYEYNHGVRFDALDLDETAKKMYDLAIQEFSKPLR